jgi:cytochrome b pre-mRNA-processing protein 3
MIKSTVRTASAGASRGAERRYQVSTFRSLFARRRHRHERAAFALYTAAVAAARSPFLYRNLGAPDTIDGRFDVVGLYVFLLIDRLRRAPPPGPDLAQAVFDAMFSDMDVNLREMGVGDLSVGKKVRTMWEAFHGRAVAYAAPLESGDVPALAAALARNVWRSAAPVSAGAERLARLALAQRAHLSGQMLDRIAAGEVAFLSAEEAARA